jgi:hypothetical protein
MVESLEAKLQGRAQQPAGLAMLARITKVMGRLVASSRPEGPTPFAPTPTCW